VYSDRVIPSTFKISFALHLTWLRWVVALGVWATMNHAEEEGKKDQKCGSGSGEVKGNWLVMLAKAMSKVQGEHLNKMLITSDTTAKSTGEGETSRQDFLDAQGEFQAESKFFGMASEATTTAIKTIGDGLSSIARKQ
jgi:hypothetical protein